MSAVRINETIHCWTLWVSGDPAQRSGSVWVRDNRTGSLSQSRSRWLDGRWRVDMAHLRCPSYVQARIKSMLARLPKASRPEVSRGDLIRLSPGSVVRLELGDILLRVSEVHHGGLLVSGTRTDDGRPMRVRFDAVDEIVSVAS